MEDKNVPLTVDEFVAQLEGLNRSDHKKLLLIGAHYVVVQ